jgi:hypothetical protein
MKTDTKLLIIQSALFIIAIILVIILEFPSNWIIGGFIYGSGLVILFCRWRGWIPRKTKTIFGEEI